jgi:hypothetical protein
MPRIVIKASVADTQTWEKSFRTNGHLFTQQSISKPVEFSVTGANEVVALFDADDAEKYVELLNSGVTKNALGIRKVEKESSDFFGFDDGLGELQSR